MDVGCTSCGAAAALFACPGAFCGGTAEVEDAAARPGVAHRVDGARAGQGSAWRRRQYLSAQDREHAQSCGSVMLSMPIVHKTRDNALLSFW